MPMLTIAPICEMLAGGLLLGFTVWLKLHDLRHIAKECAPHSRLGRWIDTATIIVLRVLAIGTIIDPLIPGVANVAVRVGTARADFADVAYAGLPEHLRVRVSPVGLGGLAGGDRVSDVALNSDGSVRVLANLALLETHVLLELYDETSPSVVIRSEIVYISPFVRRQVMSKTITLRGETNE